MLVTVNNMLILEIKIVHDLSCHPIYLHNDDLWVVHLCSFIPNVVLWLYVDHHAVTRYITEDLIRKVSGKDELESITSLSLTLAKDGGKIKVSCRPRNRRHSPLSSSLRSQSDTSR